MGIFINNNNKKATFSRRSNANAFALLVLWNAEVSLNRIYNPRKGTKSSDISISVAKLQEDLKFMKILKESQKIFPENYHHDRHNFAAYQ